MHVLIGTLVHNCKARPELVAHGLVSLVCAIFMDGICPSLQGVAHWVALGTLHSACQPLLAGVALAT